MAAHPYGRSYQLRRRQLLADNPPCYWCRRRPATTADHYPPLSEIEGPWEGRLLPACQKCNLGRVAVAVWRSASRPPAAHNFARRRKWL